MKNGYINSKRNEIILHVVLKIEQSNSRIHSGEAELWHFYIKKKHDRSFEIDTVTAYIPPNPRNTDKNA